MCSNFAAATTYTAVTTNAYPFPQMCLPAIRIDFIEWLNLRKRDFRVFFDFGKCGPDLLRRTIRRAVDIHSFTAKPFDGVVGVLLLINTLNFLVPKRSEGRMRLPFCLSRSKEGPLHSSAIRVVVCQFRGENQK